LTGEASVDERHRLVIEGDGRREAVVTDRVLIAVGSGEKLLPGMSLDPPWIVTSREFLDETTLPRSMVVGGGGAVGVEMGYVLASLGVELTIVEMEAQLLPGVEPEVARELGRALGRHGLRFRLGARLESLERSGDGVVVKVSGSSGSEVIRA